MLHSSLPSLQPTPVMAGLSLFESFETASVSGVSYYDEFIAPSFEMALMEASEGPGWNEDYRRRVKIFGRSYRGGTHYAPIPRPFSDLGQRLVAEGVLKQLPQNVHINEYLPGQGIGAHRDIDSEHIETVAIVSLGSGAVMNFSRLGRADVPIYLYQRSLLTIQGEALRRWMHAVPARKSDTMGGLILPRRRRLSAIFRG